MYELGFYIPEDRIHHSHRRENLKSCKLHHLFLAKYFYEDEILEYKTDGNVARMGNNTTVS
jgi:hypothetical protein